MFFIRTESFRQFLRWYPIISTIVAIHLILYIFTEFIPIPLFIDIRFLMVGQNLLIESGEYWRLLTPIFVHGGLMHVLFNSFSLVLFGPALEHLLGKVKFILAYLIMGILPNVAYLFLGNPMAEYVGASGAIYGLFGLYAYMMFARKDLIDSQSRQIVTVFIIIGFLTSFGPHINYIAHIFGFISGVALGPILIDRIRISYY
ncbi:rhomboid family intramembrane serine protease [Tenuibacillus multivorans]|uniref:Membrane associated serine protease, rhomboid family n=1 Tax=Tenuibacillus multivorans TaxID=237069 RepID=A0A1H0BA17_9BACI|nr:rhomboid family intramembrane serine protease [Tenuibacillus multivorans]GEL78766.1 putative rhomboid protease YdcA [Tenuibacillus multivorans]SDN42469.1 Membrane associated serine protease, rhomboid family [Tenuibacillus multivorans]